MFKKGIQIKKDNLYFLEVVKKVEHK